MASTAVEIDEELLRDAMDATEWHNARELIEDYLKQIVRYREARKKLLELQRTVEWEGSLDEMRRDRPQAKGDW